MIMEQVEQDEQTDLNPDYIRIQQIWIILTNGVCALHWLYSGKTMDENLFAAFVRALFSFSQDMAEENISNMSFGNMDIHYLPAANDKVFVAISADRGTPFNQVQMYLEWIAKNFTVIYPTYIEKMPPFEPQSFDYFHEAVKNFILFHEKRDFARKDGIEDLNLLVPIKLLQYAQDNIITYSGNNLIQIFSKNPFNLVDIIYPEQETLKTFAIQKLNSFITILTESKIFIYPINNNDNYTGGYQALSTEEFPRLDWIITHPTNPYIVTGNNNTILTINLTSMEKIQVELAIEIKKVLIRGNDQIIILNSDGELLQAPFPFKDDTLLERIIAFSNIEKMMYGPQNILILQLTDSKVVFLKNDGSTIILKEKFPLTSHIGYDEPNKLIFIITEFQELIIYSEKGSLLINYNLTENGIGCCIIEENRLIIFNENGNIQPFAGNIDRTEIETTREMLIRRIDKVDKHILRISSGINKSLEEMESIQSSNKLSHLIKQVKVYQQQIKRVIDKRLFEQVKILRDLFFRLQGYQQQIDNILPMIDDLLLALNDQHEKYKDFELSGKTLEERISNYIDQMKPRKQIGIGSLSQELLLSYDVVLRHLQFLEKQHLLPGWLTRGSHISIRDNILFVKRDPKFHADTDSKHITSF